MIDERRARDRKTPPLTLNELEQIRLLLRGGSVVDWFRLGFESSDDVQRFLRLQEFDVESAHDRSAFSDLRMDAISYLHETLNYRVSEMVTDASLEDLFLIASERKGKRRDRLHACLVLKVVHIVHHIRARELRYRVPTSQHALANMLIDKVNGFAESLIDDGFPLVRYQGGEKTLSSMITKLLVKREHHAATIHDRVRFKFVVASNADLVPLLSRMLRTLLPFNYVVPLATVNHLVNFTALVESRDTYREHAMGFQIELGHEERFHLPINEFSGSTYRVINFVADVPLRLDAPFTYVGSGAPIVFQLAEFQVVDAETERVNEEGDNAHGVYKERQKRRVRARLERGLRRVGEELDDDPTG